MDANRRAEIEEMRQREGHAFWYGDEDYQDPCNYGMALADDLIDELLAEIDRLNDRHAIISSEILDTYTFTESPKLRGTIYQTATPAAQLSDPDKEQP